MHVSICDHILFYLRELGDSMFFFLGLCSAEVVSHAVEEEKPFCTVEQLSKTTKLIFA